MPRGSKRGRPQGSKNIQYANAVHIPPTCPICGSAELRAVKGSPPIQRRVVGRLSSGMEYVAIRWQRCECSCGQRVTVRTYFPAKNNAADIISFPSDIDRE